VRETWSERRKEKEREESNGSERELYDSLFSVVRGTSKKTKNKTRIKERR
jgi:hypothetical protein